ncbi:MAG: putative oxidoreductase [Acidimicrobiia bacterium]|nr:putative oxidoreductase [Acidimicrobiia bacterium]
MRVDGGAVFGLAGAGQAAREAEEFGFDGFWSAETNHDPFLPLVSAAEATTTIELGTSIAVAFARNPMTVATLANDLQEFTGGRMVIGLGSQIKPHITKRFSMEWSHPAARMREFVLAMRAIWDCWNNGSKLNFRGDFYSHTLMTPFFEPGPNPFGPPKVALAGVGDMMTKVAGEVSDGFLCHAFSTERYLREVTVPALEEGRRLAGKTLEGFDINAPGFLVTGETEEELAAECVVTKGRIALYGSTPGYRPVLELHGWGELQDELNKLTKQGRWDDMGSLITDEMLHTFAVVAEPQNLAAAIKQRYADVATRVSFFVPPTSNPEVWRSVVAELRQP